MPYTTVEAFPEFAVSSLPSLMILPSGRPSIEKARDHPRLYIESRYIRPFRSPYLAQWGVHCGEEHLGETMAAYSDIRRSAVYPRLTASIEIEVVAARGIWSLMARARHGNQESLGSIFDFDSYFAACIHVSAWIWFARHWIGQSWVGDDVRYRVWATKSIETLDPKLLPMADTFEGPDTDTESGEDKELAVLERIFSLQ